MSEPIIATFHNAATGETIERELRHVTVLRAILATQFVHCKPTEKEFWLRLLNNAIELEHGLQVARDSLPVDQSVASGEGFEVHG